MRVCSPIGWSAVQYPDRHHLVPRPVCRSAHAHQRRCPPRTPLPVGGARPPRPTPARRAHGRRCRGGANPLEPTRRLPDPGAPGAMGHAEGLEPARPRHVHPPTGHHDQGQPAPAAKPGPDRPRAGPTGPAAHRAAVAARCGQWTPTVECHGTAHQQLSGPVPAAGGRGRIGRGDGPHLGSAGPARRKGLGPAPATARGPGVPAGGGAGGAGGGGAHLGGGGAHLRLRLCLLWGRAAAAHTGGAGGL